MIEFDYDWNGLSIIMEMTEFEDANKTHWTDVEIASEDALFEDGFVMIYMLTEETKDNIRREAYDYWLETDDLNMPDDIDRECHEYHINKEA